MANRFSLWQAARFPVVAMDKRVEKSEKKNATRESLTGPISTRPVGWSVERGSSLRWSLRAVKNAVLWYAESPFGRHSRAAHSNNKVSGMKNYIEMNRCNLNECDVR